jgi:hypothetical protein
VGNLSLAEKFREILGDVECNKLVGADRQNIDTSGTIKLGATAAPGEMTITMPDGTTKSFKHYFFIGLESIEDDGLMSIVASNLRLSMVSTVVLRANEVLAEMLQDESIPEDARIAIKNSITEKLLGSMLEKFLDEE